MIKEIRIADGIISINAKRNEDISDLPYIYTISHIHSNGDTETICETEFLSTVATKLEKFISTLEVQDVISDLIKLDNGGRTYNSEENYNSTNRKIDELIEPKLNIEFDDKNLSQSLANEVIRTASSEVRNNINFDRIKDLILSKIREEFNVSKTSLWNVATVEEAIANRVFSDLYTDIEGLLDGDQFTSAITENLIEEFKEHYEKGKTI